MANQLSASVFGLMFLAFGVLAGCASTATTKTEGASPAGQAGVRGGPAKEGRQGKAPSSLEAMRRGEAPVTPASSPLKEVYFDFDKYDLRTDARATLKANADWLKANPAVTAEIEGHADERGTNEYNLALGSKRAQTAKDYLVSLGIAGRRISTISYGEEVAVCRDKSEDCWQRNRRDRFVAKAARPGS